MKYLIMALTMLVCVPACNRQTPGRVFVTAAVDDCKMTPATGKMLVEKYPTALLNLGASSGYGPTSAFLGTLKTFLAEYKALGGDMSKVIYGLRPDVQMCGKLPGTCWYGSPHQEKFKQSFIKRVSEENKAWSITHMNGGQNPWDKNCTTCGLATWLNKDEMFKEPNPALYDGMSVIMNMSDRDYLLWFADVAVSVFTELGFTSEDAFVFEFAVKPGNGNYWDGIGPGGNCARPDANIYGGCGMARQKSVYAPGEFEKAYNNMMGIVGLKLREKFPKARFSTAERPAFKTTWSLVNDTNTNLLIGEAYNQLGTCTN